jgi:transcriptional regulator with XRE-family HTH domain
VIDVTGELESDLGRRVRAVRLFHELSQVELARQANVSVGAVKHLESGAGATVRTLMRVLHALDETSWLEALRPPAPVFSPLEVLRAQQAARPQRQRVRRRAG